MARVSHLQHGCTSESRGIASPVPPNPRCGRFPAAVPATNVAFCREAAPSWRAGTRTIPAAPAIASTTCGGRAGSRGIVITVGPFSRRHSRSFHERRGARPARARAPCVPPSGPCAGHDARAPRTFDRAPAGRPAQTRRGSSRVVAPSACARGICRQDGRCARALGGGQAGPRVHRRERVQAHGARCALVRRRGIRWRRFRSLSFASHLEPARRLPLIVNARIRVLRHSDRYPAFARVLELAPGADAFVLRQLLPKLAARASRVADHSPGTSPRAPRRRVLALLEMCPWSFSSMSSIQRLRWTLGRQCARRARGAPRSTLDAARCSHAQGARHHGAEVDHSTWVERGRCSRLTHGYQRPSRRRLAPAPCGRAARLKLRSD